MPKRRKRKCDPPGTRLGRTSYSAFITLSVPRHIAVVDELTSLVGLELDHGFLVERRRLMDVELLRIVFFYRSRRSPAASHAMTPPCNSVMSVKPISRIVATAWALLFPERQ